MVEPDQRSYGEEARGLALARLAQTRVEDDEMFARATETLAWALFANGLDGEALEEIEVAAAMAPPEVLLRLERTETELRLAIEATQDGRGEQVLQGLTQEVAELEAEVAKRRKVRFEDENDRWWFNQLTDLVVEIEAFGDPESGLIEGTSPDFGWGIARRRAWAASVEERTLTGEGAARRWAGTTALLEDARECPAYGGLTIEAQLGLVPIGRDPDSDLWEFAHPLTGEIPPRNDAGRLLVDEDTSLVFVLVPGGTYTMGAQRTRGAPNYDPNAHDGEGPPHNVTLSPFFISKFEMTQGQWLRMQNKNPSYWQGVNVAQTLLHPVEQVSWLDCTEVLRRMGLVLPTEAQWEYAARAGTTTIWSTGDERDSLVGSVNLIDQAAAAFAAWGLTRNWMELNDTWAVHAPVDSFLPNAFGLHDVHGNVWEWCVDSYDAGFYARSPVQDPVYSPYDSRDRVLRGSSYGSSEVDARSAGRQFSPLDDAGDRLGVRPVRLLDPPVTQGGG